MDVFRSTIPEANAYFLNPFSINSGENASLNVQGAFLKFEVELSLKRV
jgi:hypothetical protein